MTGGVRTAPEWEYRLDLHVVPHLCQVPEDRPPSGVQACGTPLLRLLFRVQHLPVVPDLLLYGPDNLTTPTHLRWIRWTWVSSRPHTGPHDDHRCFGTRESHRLCRGSLKEGGEDDVAPATSRVETGVEQMWSRCVRGSGPGMFFLPVRYGCTRASAHVRLPVDPTPPPGFTLLTCPRRLNPLPVLTCSGGVWD